MKKAILVFYFILSASALFAQDSLGIRFVSSAGGECRAIFIADSFAYVGEGANLVIYDISEPINPLEIGRCFTGFGSSLGGIVINGDYAYVTSQSMGLTVVNVACKTSPFVIGSHPEVGSGLRLTMQDTLLFIASRDSGLVIANISDSANPEKIAQYVGEEEGRDVFVVDTLAFYVDRLNLWILDVSSPTEPVELSNLPFRPGWWDWSGAGYHRIWVKDNFAYASLNTVYYHTPDEYGHVCDIVTIDVSDPTSPTQTDHSVLYGSLPHSIYVDDYLYAFRDNGSGDAGLRIYDISGPVLHRISYCRADCLYNHGEIFIKDNLLYYAGVDGLYLFDVSNVESPTFIKTVRTSGARGRNLIVKDTLVYLAALIHDGLRFVSVSDIERPYETGSSNMEYSTRADLIEVKDRTIVTGNRGGEYYIYYIYLTAGLRVTAVGLYCFSCLTDVKIKDTLLYWSEWHRGLAIQSIANPREPTFLTDSSLGFIGLAVEVVDTICYVLGWSGLVIINVANPREPEIITVYPETPSLTDYGADIFIRHNHLYLFGASEVKILDISDLTSPIPLGICHFDEVRSEYGGVYVRGNYAYISNGNHSLYVFDVSDPRSPVQIGYYYQPLEAFRGLQVVGDYAYVATEYSGEFMIFDVSAFAGIEEETHSIPEQISISAYPNPFNSACRVSAPPGATVEIFNILGNLVWSHTTAPSGSSEMLWTPDKSTGSGVYLVRATAGKQSATRKILYLK